MENSSSFDKEIGPLLEAFRVFDKSSRNWEKSYRKLESQFSELKREVEDRNKELSSALEKNLAHREFLRTIIDTINVGILVIDHMGTIVFINEYVEQNFPLHADSVIGKKISEVAPTWYKKTNLLKTFETKTNMLNDSISIKNHVFQCRNSCIFSDADSRHSRFLGIVQMGYDITPDTVKNNRKIAEKNAASLDQMMANISHEIKNPLLGIHTYLEILHERAENNHDKDSIKLLEKINIGLCRINGVIKQGIDFEKLPCPSFLRYDIKKLVTAAIQELQKNYSSVLKNITFIEDFSTESLFLDMDMYILKKVIYNVLCNAVEAIKDKGTITITANYDRWQNRCALRISDTGTGISQENQAYIFDPFYTTYPDKIGMGLTYARKAISLHDGKISLSSTAHGTTVIIEIPILRVNL